MSAVARFEAIPGLGVVPRLLTLAGCVLLVLPQVIVVITSIDPSATAIFPPKGISFQWYVNAFTRHEFREALAISVALATIAALVSTTIGTMAAVFVVRGRFRGRELLIASLQLPMMIPEVMLGLGFLILFSRGGMHASLFNIGLAHIVITLPFAMRVVVANLQTVSISIEEAAHVLGAGPVTSFVRVDVAGDQIGHSGRAHLQLHRLVRQFHADRLSGQVARHASDRDLFVHPHRKRPDDCRDFDVLIVVSIAGILAIDRVLGIDRLSQAGRVGG